jgi:DNA-binding CsgD family transcriptional regulator
MTYNAHTASRHLHLCIMGTMRDAVPASAAFCVSNANATHYFNGTQLVDGEEFAMTSEDAEAVMRAFVSKTMGAGPCSSYTAREAFPLWRSLMPSWQLAAEHTDLLFVALRHDGRCLGMAGLARRPSEAPFTSDDRARVNSIAPAVSALGGLHGRCEELQRREAVNQAIPGFAGTYCVVDVEARRVCWVYTTANSVPCEDELRINEKQFVDIVNGLSSTPDDEPVPSYPSLHFGRIVRVVALGSQPLFGNHPCLAVAVATSSCVDGALSRRERQIARLLVAGYTTVNAAAILNVSENTIRTYVRRLYRKLDVANRADLARKCASLYSIAPTPYPLLAANSTSK